MFVGGPVDGEVRYCAAAPQYLVPVMPPPRREYASAFSPSDLLAEYHTAIYVPHYLMLPKATAMDLRIQPEFLSDPVFAEWMDRDVVTFAFLAWEPLTRPAEPEYAGLYDDDPLSTLAMQHLERLR